MFSLYTVAYFFFNVGCQRDDQLSSSPAGKCKLFQMADCNDAANSSGNYVKVSPSLRYEEFYRNSPSRSKTRAAKLIEVWGFRASFGGLSYKYIINDMNI